jgi:hypothetical protein
LLQWASFVGPHKIFIETLLLLREAENPRWKLRVTLVKSRFLARAKYPHKIRINVRFLKAYHTCKKMAKPVSDSWSGKAVSDRLCGLVVRVLGYRSGGPVSIPGTNRKKSSGSGTRSTQPREYN